MAVEYIDFICEYCGKTFQRSAREYRRRIKINMPIRFCSRECATKARDTRVEKQCPVCGKSFLIQARLSNQNKTCSSKCAKQKYEENNSPVSITCKNCNKVFHVTKSYYNKQIKRKQEIKFCSKICADTFAKKNMIKCICVNCGNHFLINKKNVSSNGNACSAKCRKEIRQKNLHEVLCNNCGTTIVLNHYRFIHSQTHFCNRKCRNEFLSKKKDTYSDVAHYLRTSLKYSDWRKNVFCRDHYQCKKCGSKNNIHAHHKKPLYDIVQKYNYSIENILNSDEFNDIENGETLCSDCHQKEHPYIKRNQKGQFMPLCDKGD